MWVFPHERTFVRLILLRTIVRLILLHTNDRSCNSPHMSVDTYASRTLCGYPPYTFLCTPRHIPDGSRADGMAIAIASPMPSARPRVK